MSISLHPSLTAGEAVRLVAKEANLSEFQVNQINKGIKRSELTYRRRHMQNHFRVDQCYGNSYFISSYANYEKIQGRKN